MKSFLRRCLALALVLALSLTSGISAFAASADFEGEVISIDNAITAEPSGKNTLIKDELAASVKDFSGVKENEKVTFIVELEGESVLEAKPEEVSASDYMDTFEGDQTLNEIKSVQGEVQRKLNSAKTGLKVEFNYSVVMNGFAVSGPYSAKAYLESLPGVKAVYVANTYDIPETFDAADYATITSGVMLDSDVANANGYTGKGTVTAVLDTGLDLEHQAFANAPAYPTLSLSDIEAAVASGKLNAGAFAADELYISEKVPFAFDYAEYDAQVNDPNDHGTHVCGTVGADCDEFKGVAPDTQIVIMKVFNDKGSGATDAVIFAALEDAVVLGVDAINMSLGSPCGHTYEDEATEAVYGAVKAAGINLMVSAGNETDSVSNTQSLYGYALTSNPDSGIVGSPSTYDAALSVASVNEYQDYTAYILAGENKIQYTDSNSGTNVDFVKTFDG
ncbi:MAG: S8 family serine peptidase, partial [Oscillospiraceae bacterium]|nr:S8 family serine peptidase [Oscillospiraceae bacterium]